MGSRIKCFWMEPTEIGTSDLRRYERRSYDPMTPPTCPSNPMRYHDATIVIGEVPYPFDPQGLVGYSHSDDIPHDDLRWPTVCETCSTPFKEDDHWQHNVKRLFKGAPDGKLYTTRNMPPGAMWDADWWPEKGPDGITLAVALPPGGNGDVDVWMPDGTCNKSSTPWTRTGTIPNVTCRPSILTPRYHGFLTDGWLEEC